MHVSHGAQSTVGTTPSSSTPPHLLQQAGCGAKSQGCSLSCQVEVEVPFVTKRTAAESKRSSRWRSASAQCGGLVSRKHGVI